MRNTILIIERNKIPTVSDMNTIFANEHWANVGGGMLINVDKNKRFRRLPADPSVFPTAVIEI